MEPGNTGVDEMMWEEELVKRRTEKKSCTKGRREEQEWTAAARELRGRRETKEEVESVG